MKKINPISSYKLVFLYVLLFSKFNLFSQLSDLGRFQINYTKGCSPFAVIILKENLDPNVTVVQYDFNYSKTTQIFNPSSVKEFMYHTTGKYTIAQAINQDGIEKIDYIEIEVFESKIPEIVIYNCASNELQIKIEDTYYDTYNLYFNDLLIKELEKGNNLINYSSYLLPDNKLKGFIKGSFEDKDYGSNNDNSCKKFEIDLISIEEQKDVFIDSIQLSDDIFYFDLFYNPQKSSNYNLILDGNTDSTYLTPSYLYFSDYKIKINNKNFSSKCVELEKQDYCNSTSYKDNLCLVYLNVSSNKEGHLLEWITDGNFDSLEITKNENSLQKIKDNSKKFNDNQLIMSGENYCYQVRGYKNKSVSISNKICIDAEKNFNPLPIANAFTPNSDGLNDFYLPVQVPVSEYKMYIFNKLGKLIFVSEDISLGWDGYYKGKITEDTYFYKIEFNNNDKLIVQTGKFVLLK